MFLVWSCDSAPTSISTHSPSSRWPICILPSSLYVVIDGVNLTLEPALHAITESFNKLSTEGIKVRDLPSLGGGTVP